MDSLGAGTAQRCGKRPCYYRHREGEAHSIIRALVSNSPELRVLLDADDGVSGWIELPVIWDGGRPDDPHTWLFERLNATGQEWRTYIGIR
jgi:hypothetical protein